MLSGNIIQQWLTTASILVAAVVVASPVDILPRTPIVPHLQDAPIDKHDQVVASLGTDSFTIGRVVDSDTAKSNIREADTVTIGTSASYPHEGFDGSFEKRESHTDTDPNSRLEHVDHGLAAIQNVDGLRSTEHDSIQLGDRVAFHLSNAGLPRLTLGYHNYALVCASSKIHTDYCANGRRGYYCSQNGYVLLQVGGTRYVPCEEQCVCLNIGVKPACVLAWSGINKNSVICPNKDETI